MRFKVALALSVSALLILGASWTRFSLAKENSAVLVSVESEDTKPAEIDSALLATATSTDPEQLTDTDLVSRQLFSDYFSLVAKGQATPANIDNLAEAYAKSITNLNKARHMTALELNIVSNTAPNIAYYDNTFGGVYTAYRARLAEELVPADSIEAPGGRLDVMSSRISKLYADTARELQAIPVPAIAAKDHLALINTYLKASESYKALSQSTESVVNAMAGISLARESIDTEISLLESLQKALLSGGIINSNQ